MSLVHAEQTFYAASLLWLSQNTFDSGLEGIGYIRPNTEHSYVQYIRTLNLVFAEQELGKIHFLHLREYQRLRVRGDAPFIRKRRPHDQEPRPCPASPKKVNQELALLRRIMIYANCWSREHELYYRPLQESVPEIQRALSPKEQMVWLHTARAKERWNIIYWYSLLSLGTTMSTNELRSLRLGDINLEQRVIVVPPKGAKGRQRARTIALLTAEEMWAAAQILERARECGAVAMDHYVFPFRDRRKPYDPTRPMTSSGLKKQWQEVREASGLLWFRPYDLRHTGATRDAENGMNPAVRKARMGHLTQRMQDHYTHISEQAQRNEMMKVAAKKFNPMADVDGYGVTYRSA